MRINVTSIYGGRTHEPLVTLAFDDAEPINLRVEEAQSIARMLLESAESATQDGFLVEWGQTALGDERSAVALMAEYRKWRAERYGTEVKPGE